MRGEEARSRRREGHCSAIFTLPCSDKLARVLEGRREEADPEKRTNRVLQTSWQLPRGLVAVGGCLPDAAKAVIAGNRSRNGLPSCVHRLVRVKVRWDSTKRGGVRRLLPLIQQGADASL